MSNSENKMCDDESLKEGDTVNLVSIRETKEEFGYDHNYMLPIGETGIVNWIEGVEVGIGDYTYHINDLVKVNGEDKTTENNNTTENLTHTLDPSDLPTIVEQLSKPIESDGGSSSYYFTKLPKWMINQIVETGGIEIKDIVQFVFDNDAHAKDIIKAQKRIIEMRKGGGKSGLKPLYDYNKLAFFAEDQLKVAKNNLDEINKT